MAFLRKEDDGGEDLNIDTHSDAPARYVSLDRVYSAAASLCVSSSNVMSKKVKARKLILKGDGEPEPPLLKVYSRRPKSHKQCADVEAKDHDDESLQKNPKRRRLGCSELVKLGVDSTVLSVLDKPRLRDCRNNCNMENGSPKKRKRIYTKNSTLSGPPDKKHWAVLNLEGADPKALIGLRCQVFWPLDADWYSGKVVGYNAETNRHHVQYEDGDTENLIICNEKIRFHISKEELEKLNLKLSDNCDNNDSEDMVVMAASLDDCQEFEAGDIVWAKLTGHAMWPAIIVDEAVIRDRPGLSKISGERSVLVQFFGTHDFARIKVKQVMSFLNGLLSSFHQKCKKQNFVRSIQEAKIYLSEQRLPKRMRLLQKGVNASGTDSYSSDDERSSDADEPHMKSSLSQRSEKINGESPFVTEGLQILSLGKIVNDSDHFRDDRFVWPEGYTALRKFTSLTDPNGCSLYKMEVLRDPQLKNRPLFRVTLDSGEQIEGSNPSACWNKIYKRIRGMRNNTSDGAELEAQGGYLSGSDMFGFSNSDIVKLMKGLTKSKLHLEISTRKGISGRNRDLSVGYRPVRVDWKDLDKCSVCHMDEEYENNLFLQCDKCRMMVHARCYGEHESVDGVLWLCNLCRPGAPESPPPCCLCPVTGGALKPTTDGRWAHLACAIWIPETCLSDIKRMEPIDGIDRISKDRWKLLCSICGVYYGACIQCSNSSCRVAYHPLCARAAGLCVELEDEDRFLLLSVDDDDTEDQCIRLLSFCKRHRQPSNERSTTDEVICRTVRQCSDYSPPLNPSGCARSEPYNHIGRRGRKEPEALSAASLKRLFVENRPHVVAGHSHRGLSGNMLPLKRVNGLKFTSSFHGIKGFQDDTLHNILSVAEKYKYMRETFRKRLVFGKSGIHGFGIFAKHPHRAGDMVIEYTGELVRPSIADRREHLIYNSLVGAGTYMFRIDDERVIDATRAGSIAHLINHSCEPNCYSRVICVNGDNHIIIFAKRDIKRWEELTYDYRFFSIDEHLACYCGFPRCRGVVNDTEAGERLARINVPRSELVDWTGE